MTYLNSKLVSDERVDDLTSEERNSTDTKEILNDGDLNQNHVTKTFNELGVACDHKAEKGTRCLLVFGINSKIQPGLKLVLNFPTVTLLSDSFERCDE